MSPEHLIQQYGYAALVMGTFVEGETVLLLGGVAACLNCWPFMLAITTTPTWWSSSLTASQ